MKPALSLIRALALLVSLLPSLLPLGGAHASVAKAWDTCTPANGTTTHSSATVNIGRDALSKEPIGPWLTFPTITWTCTRGVASHFVVPTSDRYAIQASVGPADGTSRCIGADWCNTSLEGKNYEIYKYKNEYANKIGFVAELQYEMQGEPASEFIPLPPRNTKFHIEAFSGGVPRQAGQTFWFKTTLRVRLIRNGSIDNFPSSIDGSIVQIKLKTRQYTSNWTYTWSDHPTAQRTYALTTNFPLHHAACTTPNFTVDLGAVNAHVLNASGDAGPASDFEMRIEKCPPYMRAISYRFMPVPDSVSIINGILPLNPNQSTAKGVGVQVLHADGITPLVLGVGTAQFLAGYDAYQAPHSTYTIPLKARIIRTTGPLNFGTVYTQMTMIMRYK